MFIKVGNGKIMRSADVDQLYVEFDNSPDSSAYAIFYSEKRNSSVLAHYATDKEAKEVLENIITAIVEEGDKSRYVCEIPEEDPSMYRTLNLTTTSGTVVTFKYSPECCEELMNQFYIHSKHDTYRIKHKGYSQKLTGKYKNIEDATSDLAGLRNAIMNNLPEFSFTLGSSKGIWYTKHDD